MKIQAINTNTNFKGLFTDKSAQNNGNWRMEYRRTAGKAIIPEKWQIKNV